MAIWYADRVAEYGTVSGTGSVTLTGVAPTGFKTFAQASLGVSKICYIMIDDLAGKWEITKSTYNGTTTATRAATPESTDNSSGGSIVNFTAASVLVSLVYPASKLGEETVYTDKVTGSNYKIVIVSGAILKEEVA